MSYYAQKGGNTMSYEDRRIMIITLSNIFHEDVKKGVDQTALKTAYEKTYGEGMCHLIFKRLELRGMHV